MVGPGDRATSASGRLLGSSVDTALTIHSVIHRHRAASQRGAPARVVRRRRRTRTGSVGAVQTPAAWSAPVVVGPVDGGCGTLREADHVPPGHPAAGPV